MHKTNIQLPDHAWFALADAEHCRLLCCRLTRQGTKHVDEHGALENTLPEAEHERPQAGDGMTHDIEEEERRFAAEIVKWLKKKASEHDIARLAIFASPRMLGVLRKASSGLLKGHLEELEGNLMRLKAGQLAEHPMVRKLVRAAHERFPRGDRGTTSRRASKSSVGQRAPGELTPRLVGEAWRAGSRVAGPASAPRSRGRHAATTGGLAGRTGRRRGEK